MLWLHQNLESEQLDNQLLEPAPVPTARPAQAAAARPHAAQAAPALPNVPQVGLLAAALAPREVVWRVFSKNEQNFPAQGGRPAAAKPAKTQEELELEALEQEMAA